MALTSSGVKYRGHYEPLPGGVHHVPFPDPLAWVAAVTVPASAPLEVTMRAIEQLFATMCYPDDVAAFIVEPILGEGGYVIPPDGFLPALRELADRHGILLITDEIQTGYGRTGRFFASEWTGAGARHRGHGQGHRLWPAAVGDHGAPVADRPLPAIGPRRHVRRQRRACAAALATLDVIEDEGLVANAERQGERLLAGLRSAATGVAGVADVRGRGLMLAIEFAGPGHARPPRPSRQAASAPQVDHAIDVVSAWLATF